MNPNFICYPVRASDQNPDGSPACIEECPLADAQWIGVYRQDSEAGTDWVFDVEIAQFTTPELALQVAEGLCELLNALTPQDALHNPKLHVFFR